MKNQRLLNRSRDYFTLSPDSPGTPGFRAKKARHQDRQEHRKNLDGASWLRDSLVEALCSCLRWLRLLTLRLVPLVSITDFIWTKGPKDG